MKTSQKGIDLICKYEGCVLKAYKCPAGVWTIGFGHTKGVRQGDQISLAEAVDLLREDLPVYEEAVDRAVAINLTQGQFDALVSFTYNMGEGTLLKSSLLKKLNMGEIEAAAKVFLLYNKAKVKGVLTVLKGLVARRAAEKKLFES